jgi:hypothetical protein
MLKVDSKINEKIEILNQRFADIQPMVDAIYQTLLEKIAKSFAEVDTQDLSFADFRLVGSVSEETSISSRPTLDFLLFVESSLTEEETVWSSDELLVSLVFNIVGDAVVGHFLIQAKYFVHDSLVLHLLHCESGLPVSITHLHKFSSCYSFSMPG